VVEERLAAASGLEGLPGEAERFEEIKRAAAASPASTYPIKPGWT